jgi:hypothetical protein
MPVFRRVKARQQLGHRDARPLATDDDLVLAGDDLHRVIDVQTGAFQRRRANSDGCSVAPPRYFAWADQKVGHGRVS